MGHSWRVLPLGLPESSGPWCGVGGGLAAARVPPLTRHRQCPASRKAGSRQYDYSMKMKTSITLEREVVTAVEEAAREGESRSHVIERLLRQSLAARARAAIDTRDLNLINAHADELNEEAVDVLGYQVEM